MAHRRLGCFRSLFPLDIAPREIVMEFCIVFPFPLDGGQAD